MPRSKNCCLFKLFDQMFDFSACDVLMGLVEQTSIIHNETLINSLERICNYLPDQFKNPCKIFLEYIGPILIEMYGYILPILFPFC